MKKLGLCLAITALLLSACTGGDAPLDTDDLSFLDANGASVYTVIRPDNSEKAVTDISVKVKHSLEAALGVTVSISTDWLERGTDVATATAGLYEILVGETNRPESAMVYAELGESEYAVRRIGNKIVIAGYDGVATMSAASAFLESCFTADGEGGYEKSENPVFSASLALSGKYDLSQGALDGRYYVSSIDGWYKTQGRTFVNDDGLALLYTATSFEFNAVCSGKVSLTFRSDNVTEGAGWGVYFTVYVDGVTDNARHRVDNGDTVMVLAENLPAGDHSFAVYRQTEHDRGNTNVYSIEFENDGRLAPPPADRELYIEFIGDSLTSGFGNLTVADTGHTGDWDGAPIYQDGVRSYGFIAAQELDADVSIVAIQGIGICCGPQTRTMPEVYEHFPYINDAGFQYDFTRKADIVVINMTTNDYENYASRGISVKEIMDNSVSFSERVRELYPDSVIIWATGMQPSFTREMTKIVERLGGEENGYYYLPLIQNLKGMAAHTDVAGHYDNAELLVNFIRNIIE